MLHAILPLAPWGQVPVVSPKTLLSTRTKSCWYQAKQAHIHSCHERLWTRHSGHCRLHPKKETSRLLVRKPFKSVNLKIFWILNHEMNLAFIYPSFIFQENAGMVLYSFWPRCLIRPTWPPSGLQWAVANDAGSKRCKYCMICSMEESSSLTMLTGAVGAANELMGFKALLVKRDVEYRHLDATVPNIPECFFQILSHPLLLAGLQPNLIVCSAAIAACEKGRGFIMRLLRKSREKL